MNEFVARVIGVMAITAIGKGLLLWLGSQYQIYPERWAAELIGLAVNGVTSYPSISWMLAGLVGLIGLFVGPSVYKWGMKILKPYNKTKQEQYTKKSYKRLNDWVADKKTIGKFHSIANEHTNIKITYFDNRNFHFSERLASAFELSGWKVNFNKTAQGNYNPHYYEGVEIKGDNRILVESIASTLESSGCAGIKTTIGATEIKPDHPKYPHAQHKIFVTIGYEQ